MMDPLIVTQGINVLYGVTTLAVLVLGLAVVFGLLGVLNIAHGEFIMVGAYCAYVAEASGWPFFAAGPAPPPGSPRGSPDFAPPPGTAAAAPAASTRMTITPRPARAAESIRPSKSCWPPAWPVNPALGLSTLKYTCTVSY